MRGKRISRRTFVAGAAATATVAAIGPALASCGGDDPEEVDAQPLARQSRSNSPNIVIVTADDMRYDELPFMPSVQSLLLQHGTSFTAARHNVSLCSPSRAGLLTGQFARRHGVLGQRHAFRASNDETNTLPVWMQRAGYHTGLLGKYFTAVEGSSGRLPGWDFDRRLGAKNQSEFGYSVWDGQSETQPSIGQTEYLREQLLAFVGNAPEPFFMWFTPTANHYPFEVPAGIDASAVRIDWPDSREEDVSDKPPWIRALPPMTDSDLALAREYQRLRATELLGLDETIGALIGELEARQRLEDTVIVFTSDNGVLQGEHRLPLLLKNVPYEPSVRVPCVVRGRDFPSGAVAQPVHMSIDLTATCIDLARASAGLALDGVSLREVAGDPARFSGRALLYERESGATEESAFDCPAAVGVSTVDRKLVRYATVPPTYELYDLENDPGELENRAGAPEFAADLEHLESTLDELLRDERS